MTKRKSLSKKVRFEVFKRDSFRCQYCGCSAPDVVLQVDHIKAVSKGGDNDLMNLVTACFDCNSGKSNRCLDDNSVLTKQRAQLEELNERREQLKMMLQWRDQLKDLSTSEAEALARQFEEATGYTVHESGYQKIEKWLKRHKISALLDALDTSCRQYLKGSGIGEYSHESVEKAFQYIPRIAAVKARGGQDETTRELYYIRGILRNRLQYCNEKQCMEYLRAAVEHGAELEELRELARRVRNWTAFRDSIQSFLTLGEWRY